MYMFIEQVLYMVLLVGELDHEYWLDMLSHSLTMTFNTYMYTAVYTAATRLGGSHNGEGV